MSRKNTILIAVMINIGLLAVLFFTASKQKEKELPFDPTGFLVENEMEDTAIVQENKSQTENDAQIVHVLPDVIEEKKTLSIAEKNTHLAPKSEKQVEVTVKKGDSLDKIAKAYLVSVDDIVELNNLKTTIIRIGQSLKIPDPNKKVQIRSKNLGVVDGEYYTVKPGDNPWTIAMKYNIKVEDLLKMNSLNKEKAKKLRPGDKLKIR